MDRTLLPAIAAFGQVAREKSFTRAASVMGVSPSALSQTIRVLEERLKVRLLNRSTRSISLTEEGRHLLAEIAPGLAQIDQAIHALGAERERPMGEIRINTSRVASRCFVEPHLGEFARRFPLVRLELVFDDGLGDIVHDGCDAGIRLRESISGSMVAVPLGPPFAMAVVGSPAYFEKHPVPKVPADLGAHDCVRYRHTTRGAIYRWEFTDPNKPSRDIEVEPLGSFTTNDDESMVRLALQGVGLAMHIEPAVRAHLADGTLRRVLTAWCPPIPGFHLYLPSRAHLSTKMRAFIDFFTEMRTLAGGEG